MFENFRINAFATRALIFAQTTTNTTDVPLSPRPVKHPPVSQSQRWAAVDQCQALQLDRREIATPTTNAATPKWTPISVRTGLIARKRGMTSMYDDDGTRVPVTVLQVRFAICV